MKLSDVPEGVKFLDVDGIPVVRLSHDNFIAFEKRGAPESRLYPNASKAGAEGDSLSRAEFADWLASGFNRFDAKR